MCTNLKCLPTDSSETVGQKVPKRRGGKCVVIIASCESLYSYISCPCFRCDRCVYHCLSVNYCCPLNCSSAQGRASIPAQCSLSPLKNVGINLFFSHSTFRTFSATRWMYTCMYRKYVHYVSCPAKRGLEFIFGPGRGIEPWLLGG